MEWNSAGRNLAWDWYFTEINESEANYGSWNPPATNPDIYISKYTHTLRSTPTHQPWQQKHLSFASPSGSFSSYWSSRQHSGSLSSGGHLPYAAQLWRMLAGFTAKNQVRRQDKAKKAQRNQMCNSTFPPKIYILYLLPPNQNSLKTGYERNFSSTPRVLHRRHVYAHLDIM